MFGRFSSKQPPKLPDSFGGTEELCGKLWPKQPKTVAHQPGPIRIRSGEGAHCTWSPRARAFGAKSQVPEARRERSNRRNEYSDEQEDFGLRQTRSQLATGVFASGAWCLCLSSCIVCLSLGSRWVATAFVMLRASGPIYLWLPLEFCCQGGSYEGFSKFLMVPYDCGLRGVLGKPAVCWNLRFYAPQGACFTWTAAGWAWPRPP